MKRFSFLIIGMLFTWAFSFAADYEKLYIVGNATSVGWDNTNAIEMQAEGDGIFTWSGPLTDNSNDQARFKFLVSKEWNPSLTCRMDVDEHLVITSGQEYDLYEREEHDTRPDNAFQAPENGVYSIRIDINTMKMICTKVGEDENMELTQLYLIGSATEVGWVNDNPLEMESTSEGVFTWTGTLSAEDGNEFKFLNRKNTWNKTINPKNADTPVSVDNEYELQFRPYETSPDDFKFQVTTTGEYTITVNLNEMKMSIKETQVDGIRNNMVNPFEVVIKNRVVEVTSQDNATIQSVELFDITGKNVINNNISTGLYIVKVKCDNADFVQKIMVR